MSTFVAVLIALLKIVGVLAVFVLCVIIAILILPVSISGSGFCSLESNIEEVLDKLDEPELDSEEIALFLADYEFELKTKMLMGLLSVWMTDSEFPYLRILGIKKSLQSGGKSYKRSDRAADEPTGLEPKKAEEIVELQDSKTSTEPKKSEKRGKSRKSKKSKRVSLKELKKMASAPVRSRVTWAIKSVLKATHLEADLDLELGFHDPSYTGMVYGLFSAYAGAFGVKGVRLYPNFENQRIAVDGSASMWVMPAQLLWIAARFMFDSEIRHFWWKRNK